MEVTNDGTNGVDGFHVYFDAEVASPPANLVGASVRVTITVTTASNAALTVPLSALTLAPDGSSRVQRSVNGRTEFVPVTPGLTANGFVAVTANNSTLNPGDLVVIGTDNPETNPVASSLVSSRDGTRHG